MNEDADDSKNQLSNELRSGSNEGESSNSHLNTLVSESINNENVEELGRGRCIKMPSVILCDHVAYTM